MRRLRLTAMLLLAIGAWPALHGQATSPKTAIPAQVVPVAAVGPKLVDITAATRIHFEHLSSPEQRYIVESMGGGVALLDYDGDGWLDIFFTNAPSVAMALDGKRARSALWRKQPRRHIH